MTASNGRTRAHEALAEMGCAETERPIFLVHLRPHSYGKTLALLSLGDADCADAIIHTGLLRIGSADDVAAWTAASANAARVKPWWTEGDEKRIADALDAAVRTQLAETLGEKGDSGTGTADMIVDLALDDYRLGTSTEGESFAVEIDGPNIARSLRGSADALRARLSREFRRRQGRTPSSSALTDAFCAIAGEAQDADAEPVHLRSARHKRGLVIDMGDAAGRAIVVEPEGWRVVDRSPVLFRRSALTGEMPTPERGGSLTKLWELIAVSPRDRALVLGWLLHSWLPGEPHAVLLLGGPQGGGKTTAAEILAGLVDPGSPPRTVPRDPRQWSIVAAASSLVPLDNVSSLPEWLSDAICKAASGDAWIDRALYQNSELVVLRFFRSVLLTSIDVGALRGDLGDRIVLVDFERITRESRRSKREIDMRFAAARPGLLGALLDLFARVLVELPRVEAEALPRMADYARILLALDRIEGRDPAAGALAWYVAQTERVAQEVVEGDAVAGAVVEWWRRRNGEPWEGTATELLVELTLEKPASGWPKSGRGLAGRLRRAAEALREFGVEVVPPSPTDKTRIWHLAPAVRNSGATRCDPHPTAQNAQPSEWAASGSERVDSGRAVEQPLPPHRPGDSPGEIAPSAPKETDPRRSGGPDSRMQAPSGRGQLSLGTLTEPDNDAPVEPVQKRPPLDGAEPYPHASRERAAMRWEAGLPIDDDGDGDDIKDLRGGVA